MSAWLEILRKKGEDQREDRGLMATLRCYLVASKKYRAYSALYRLGISIDSEPESLAAALYAMHPMHNGSLKNFGTTALLIERERKKKDNKITENKNLTPTERKFQHLLSAEPGKELHERIIRFVMLARAEEIPINYEQLQKGLMFWNKRTRCEWAMEFWKISKPQSNEDESQQSGDES